VRHFGLFFGVLMVGLLALARPAAADIPPVGACSTSQVGKACDEAVDASGDIGGSGVCVAEQCTRATPSGPMTYDCAMCRPKPTEPNAGGAGNEPTPPTAGAGAAGKPTSTPESHEGGCNMSAGERGTGSALASLLVLGWALARRRSSSKPS